MQVSFKFFQWHTGKGEEKKKNKGIISSRQFPVTMLGPPFLGSKRRNHGTLSEHLLQGTVFLCLVVSLTHTFKSA